MGDYLSDSQPATRKRPFGLYAIMVLLVLRILSILADIFRMQLDLHALTVAQLENPLWTDAVGWVLVAVLAIVVVELWFLKRWAWVTTMILVGLGLAFGIWQHFHGIPSYIVLLTNLVTVFYLNQRDVQRAFERGRSVEVPA
jgi:uncharacterized membrane protein (DUF2068 family)